MKRALSLILVLVLCFTLGACGSNNQITAETTEPTVESKDDLLARAEKIDVYDLHMALQENIVNAEAEYKGKTLLLTGYITKLDKEGVTLRCGTWGTENFRVKLAPEDITKVYVNQFIDIVGILTQVDGGLVVDNAYYINDIYTISGTVVFGYYDIDGRIATEDDLENHYCYGIWDYWEFWLEDTEDSYNYDLNLGFGSNIKHERDKRITEINYHGVTLRKGDKITITTKMEQRNGTDGREFTEIISIKKN